MTNKSITQCTHVKNLISMQPGLIIYSVENKNKKHEFQSCCDYSQRSLLNNVQFSLSPVGRMTDHSERIQVIYSS